MNECQKCGRSTKCLEVHHIIYRKHGGTDAIDNLIMLCPTCHREEHLPLYKVNMFGETPEMWQDAAKEDCTNINNGLMLKLSGSQYKLYCYAKRWVKSPKGVATFTVREAVKGTGLSKATVCRVLKELQDDNFITRVN